MANAAQDLTHIQAKAAGIADLMNPNTPMKAGCKGKTAGHCRQRAVLMWLGWVPPEYWTAAPGDPRGPAAIKRLQAALKVTVDGNWGPETNKALADVVSAELNMSIDPSATLKPGGGGGGQKQPPGKKPAVPGPGPVIDEGEPFNIMGIPWWAALGLLLTTAGVSFYLYKRGKRAGLSGCGCSGALAELPGVSAEEAMPPDLAEAIENVKAIPAFLQERPPRRKGTKGTVENEE